MEIRESKREENKRVRRKLKRVGEKGGGRAGRQQGVLGAAGKGFEGCERSVSGLSATLHQ